MPACIFVVVSWRCHCGLFVFVCQGLFRIAAGASKLKKLKAALDCSTSQLEEFYSDPHAVAGTSQTTDIFEYVVYYLDPFSRVFSIFTTVFDILLNVFDDSLNSWSDIMKPPPGDCLFAWTSGLNIENICGCVVSGALKSYLRELPEPLMTHQLYDEWIQASRQGS